MQFKKWLQLEMGPGGHATMDNPAKDMLDRAKYDASKGVGAFPQGGDNPPVARKTAIAGYEDPRFYRKAMRKKMHKRMKRESVGQMGPFGQQLMALRPQMAHAAQQIYNAWDQGANPEGGDWEVGFGGICDQISRAVADVIVSSVEADVRDGGQPGDDHAYIIAYNETEAYGIDISPSTYETGGGYTWQKVPDVQFDPEDVEIWPFERSDIGEEY
jgi:hypothetical protein